MHRDVQQYLSRPARYVPRNGGYRVVCTALSGELKNISRNGVLFTTSVTAPPVGCDIGDLRVETEVEDVPLPGARVVRVVEGEAISVACTYDDSSGSVFDQLAPSLSPPSYVRTDLLRAKKNGAAKGLTKREFARFARPTGRNLLTKCESFFSYIDGLQEAGAFQTLYRITTTTGLDHRATVYNPFTQREEEFICFDSNSYLGLHRHPRVLEATHRALDSFGYGSPSSPILSGTSRYLRELEETISAFHGREETIVFSSGYGANLGTIGALVSRRDTILADRYSHASLHDGAKWSGATTQLFPHNDTLALREMLNESDPRVGALVISDGVFSMHGGLVDLPGLRGETRRANATLMIDEAHATGVLGRTGRGVEEHFNLPGSIDILMGTLSKAPGTNGGYVSGPRELITYLRFFARSAMFSTALSAPLCAGAVEAFKLMMEDPEPRERLRANCNMLVRWLSQVGYRVSPTHSAIVTLVIGDPTLLLEANRKLYDRGIKCGAAAFPAVQNGRELLRLAVNARHTREDLERAVDALKAVGGELGILT